MKKILSMTIAATALLMVSCSGGSKGEQGEALAEVDSMLFYLGQGQASGIHGFAVNQLGVTDDTYSEFLRGVDEGTQKEIEPDTADIADAKKKAYNAGLVVAWELRQNINMKQLTNIYFDGDTTQKTLSLRGIYDGLRYGLEQHSKVSEEEWMKECDAAITRFSDIMRPKAEAFEKREAEARIATNATYLAELEKQPGVKKLETGEYYKVLTAGTGAVPAADEKVQVHYEGRLLDGTVFDSSYQRGKPFEIDMANPRVIQGWIDVLKVMPKGSKWEVTLPVELAYGPLGNPPVIPGNSILVFVMELMQ